LLQTAILISSNPVAFLDDLVNGIKMSLCNPRYAGQKKESFILIARMLEKTLQIGLRSPNLAIVLSGPRRAGKTALLKTLLDGRDDVLWLNAAAAGNSGFFESVTTARLKAAIGDKTIVVIDEAQRISDAGLKLESMTDQIQHVKLIASASSASSLDEHLVGRKLNFTLFPLSFAEMSLHHGLQEELQLLGERLVFGYYPEVVASPGNEINVLDEIADSWLLKDILTINGKKGSEELFNLLRALAYQIGSEISCSELGNMFGMDKKTIERHIFHLEQSHVVFRLLSLPRGARDETNPGRKIYFVDNGVRNAIIQDFSSLTSRGDIGMLWENFMMSERLKRNAYAENGVSAFYWRGKQQQKIDYIEESDGRLHAFEFKWGAASKAKKPKAFQDAYPGCSFEIINRGNFEGFVMPPSENRL
jgi:predicted AAA+ superfamily ATPase